MSHVESDNKICLPIDSRFQNHFVSRVRKLGRQEKLGRTGTPVAASASRIALMSSLIGARRFQVLRSFQHGLVFEHERH
jgi:hypothetical protein